ncbi:hypothetical protein ACP3T3_19645 [Chryseobacterium sp. CBSDS_008]|uniref:hypothetical protein n=1 Tax=Chryseobacterium sp. CBSDS_008 TaxID=3415265 RepID=UPI003CE7479A
MKKLFLFLSFLFLISCKSQNKNMNIPTVDNSFEKFDFSVMNKYPKNSLGDVKLFLDNGNYLNITKTNDKIYYIETFKDSYSQLYKAYYKNGNIKSKGMGFNGDAFQKGIWYEFDESGKLIKKTDYDQPFKFTFEDIVKFCVKENIPLTKGPVIQSTGFHTMIRRSAENQQPIWEIEWLKKPDVVETIIVDGISDKVISRKEAKYINN